MIPLPQALALIESRRLIGALYSLMRVESVSTAVVNHTTWVCLP